LTMNSLPIILGCFQQEKRRRRKPIKPHEGQVLENYVYRCYLKRLGKLLFCEHTDLGSRQPQGSNPDELGTFQHIVDFDVAFNNFTNQTNGIFANMSALIFDGNSGLWGSQENRACKRCCVAANQHIQLETIDSVAPELFT
jgi:hypothetical protein